MAGVSLVVVLFGYSIFYYGLCQVKGKTTVGFTDVLVPGKYVPSASSTTTAAVTHRTVGTTGTTGVDTYGGGTSPGPVYVKGT